MYIVEDDWMKYGLLSDRDVTDDGCNPYCNVCGQTWVRAGRMWYWNVKLMRLTERCDE